MPGAFVGPPTDHRAVCGHQLHLGAPQCTERAVVHLRVECPGGCHSFRFRACEQHRPVMASAGRVLQEHRFDPAACGLPGFVWNIETNRCVIDDSGVEPDLSAAALVGAP